MLAAMHDVRDDSLLLFIGLTVPVSKVRNVASRKPSIGRVDGQRMLERRSSTPFTVITRPVPCASPLELSTEQAFKLTHVVDRTQLPQSFEKRRSLRFRQSLLCAVHELTAQLCFAHWI